MAITKKLFKFLTNICLCLILNKMKFLVAFPLLPRPLPSCHVKLFCYKNSYYDVKASVQVLVLQSFITVNSVKRVT